LRVYRVLHHRADAAPTEPGGVLFIPPQGHGRVDNPLEYETLYVGDSPAGACAEVFNRGRYRTEWRTEMLRGLPNMPTSRRALAWYDVADAALICDLDDPRVLTARSLRPSNIATRDYAKSQAWALRIHGERRWAGVRWWSYHDARWASIGLWNHSVITTHGTEALTLDHPALIEAAAVLSIRIVQR